MIIKNWNKWESNHFKPIFIPFELRKNDGNISKKYKIGFYLFAVFRRLNWVTVHRDWPRVMSVTRLPAISPSLLLLLVFLVVFRHFCALVFLLFLPLLPVLLLLLLLLLLLFLFIPLVAAGFRVALRYDCVFGFHSIRFSYFFCLKHQMIR